MAIATMAFIQCRLILALETKDKTQRKLKALTEGRALEGTSVSSYWKIPGTFEANFTVRLNPGSRRELVFETVRFAASLAEASWSLHGPFPSGDLIFWCVLNAASKNTPLQWASLELNEDA